MESFQLYQKIKGKDDGELVLMGYSGLVF